MRVPSNIFLVCVWCPAFLWAQSPVGVVSSSDAKLNGTATMVPGGLGVASGTEIEAQKVPADIRLSRGGQLRVCPGTKVTVSSSRDGQELQFSMGEGSVEARYSLGPHGDTFLTPDLRIVVSGPGQVDLIVAADAAGNSCINNRGLDAPFVVVSQLLGDGVYRVQPDAKVLLQGGHVDRVQAAPNPCGCPQFPAQTESGISGKPVRDEVGQLAQNQREGGTAGPGTTSAETPVPPRSPGEVQIQVDAPLVFDARTPGPTNPETSEQERPPGAIQTAHHSLSDLSIGGPPNLQPQQPREIGANAESKTAVPVRAWHALQHFFSKLLGK